MNKSNSRSNNLQTQVAFVAVIGVLILVIIGYLDNRALKSNGNHITGQILKHHIDQGRKDHSYNLDYQFKIGQQLYQNSSVVSYADFNAIKDGSPADVVYDATDPTRSELSLATGPLAMSTSGPLSTILCCCAPIALLAVSGLTLYWWIQSFRTRHLV